MGESDSDSDDDTPEPATIPKCAPAPAAPNPTPTPELAPAPEPEPIPAPDPDPELEILLEESPPVLTHPREHVRTEKGRYNATVEDALDNDDNPGRCWCRVCFRHRSRTVDIQTGHVRP